MNKMMTAVLFTFICCSLSACGFYYPVIPTTEPAPLPTSSRLELPALLGDWHITVNQSGGIAGVSRSLELSGNGKLIITNLRGNKQTVSQLSDEKLAELAGLIKSSRYQPPSKPSGCADCFVFDITVFNADQKFQAQVDDVSLPDSGLEPLMTFLGKYLNSGG